jgi:hypothetical protein
MVKARFPRHRRSGTRAEKQHAARPRGRRGAGSADPSARGSSENATGRIRQAGGPIDRASYSCACGYVFVADVSTTVRCPHCKASQAW